jgi:hypothetical protein
MNLSSQVRSGQVRSGQVRSGQVRSGQVRLGQVREEEGIVGDTGSIYLLLHLLTFNKVFNFLCKFGHI